ncbi:MAG: hypothetical protein U5K00_15480 [Melioribacteraceae bacterium]|nr:hypothetical protein [Melioribacteraceae bacterium]
MIDCTLILTARRTNLIEQYLSKLNNKRAKIIVDECDVADNNSVNGE